MEQQVMGTSGQQMSKDVLIENAFTVTKEIYMEYIKAIMKRYRRVYFVFGLVCLGMAVNSFGNTEPTQFLIMLVLSGFCFCAPFYMTYASRDKKYAMQIEKNGGRPMERKAQFFEDHVEFFGNNGAHTVFGYEHITRVINSKNIYVIYVRRNIAMIIVKDSFFKRIAGRFEGFDGSQNKMAFKIRRAYEVFGK